MVKRGLPTRLNQLSLPPSWGCDLITEVACVREFLSDHTSFGKKQGSIRTVHGGR